MNNNKQANPLLKPSNILLFVCAGVLLINMFFNKNLQLQSLITNIVIAIIWLKIIFDNLSIYQKTKNRANAIIGFIGIILEVMLMVSIVKNMM